MSKRPKEQVPSQLREHWPFIPALLRPVPSRYPRRVRVANTSLSARDREAGKPASQRLDSRLKQSKPKVQSPESSSFSIEYSSDTKRNFTEPIAFIRLRLEVRSLRKWQQRRTLAEWLCPSRATSTVLVPRVNLIPI